MNAQGLVLLLERSSDPFAYLRHHQASIDHDVVTALTAVSYGYASTGDLENAEKWAGLAEEASLLGGTLESQADVCLCRSRILLSAEATRTADSLEKALESANRALTLYRTAGLLDSIPGTLEQVAAVQDARGNPLPALQALIESVIAWAQAAQRPEPSPAVLTTIVSSYRRLPADEKEAGGELLRRYGSAVLTAAPWAEGTGLADLLVALGDTCESRGAPEDALAHWERAATIYHRTGPADDEFLACRRAQAAAYSLGRLDSARLHGERCSALRHAVTPVRGAAECLHTLAATYHRLNRIDLTVSALLDAYELFRQSDSPDGAAACLLELALVALASGDLTAARANLERLLASSPAQQYAWIACAILTKRYPGESTDLATMIRYAEQAVEYSAKGMSQTVHAVSLMLSGSAHFEAENFGAALDRFRKLTEVATADEKTEQLSISAFYSYSVTSSTRSQAALLAFKAAQAFGSPEESAKFYILHSLATLESADESANMARALREITMAQTEEDRHRVLESEQTLLLTPDAGRLLTELAARARAIGAGRTANDIQALCALLFEAQIIGIPSAWAKLRASREREAMAVQAESERQAAAEKATTASAANEREISDAEREAFFEKHGVRNLKRVYDTAPRPGGGMSWIVRSDPGQRASIPFRTTTVESWLLLTSFRDQRHFLEKHLELLSQEGMVYLGALRAVLRRNASALLGVTRHQPDDIDEGLRDLREHAELLDDARSRGRTAEAVRDAYVNAHGGFMADIPPWAEDVLARLAYLEATATGNDARDFREALLRDAVARAEQDPDIEQETLAEFRNELGRTLVRQSPDPRRFVAAATLHRQALQVFGPEHYPRQWLRTSRLIAEAEDGPASGQSAASAHGRPGHIDEKMALGSSHLQTEVWPQAASLFLQVTRLAPEHADAWLCLAKAYNELKFYADALDAAKSAVKHAPDSADAWALLGALHTRQDEHDDALAAYQRAAALTPDDINLWFQIAEALKSLQRKEDAISTYDRILSIQPNHPIAWHNKGDLLDSMSRYDEALAAYDNGLSAAPNLFPALINKGITLLKMSRYEDALTSFDKALKEAPQIYLAWYGRGTALLQLHRYAEALSALEGALMLDQANTSLWSNLAVALTALGRNEEASFAKRRAEAAKTRP